MRLEVREISQMASGGSYVVIFEADVELSGNATSVHVLKVEPPESDQEITNLAKAAILRGAERALSPRGLSASIRLERLVINSVDMKPNRFELFTAVHLDRVLAMHGLGPQVLGGT